MTHIDLPLARQILADAVKVKGPDHVQNACLYVEFDNDDTASPGCIVGTGLLSLVPLLELSETFKYGNNSARIDVALQSLDMTASKDALTYLDRAQRAQDGDFVREEDDYAPRKFTWSEAIAHAEARFA